jgi:hypothetical protein
LIHASALLVFHSARVSRLAGIRPSSFFTGEKYPAANPTNNDDVRKRGIIKLIY